MSAGLEANHEMEGLLSATVDSANYGARQMARGLVEARSRLFALELMLASQLGGMDEVQKRCDAHDAAIYAQIERMP